MNIEWEKYKNFLMKQFPVYASRINISAESYDIDELGRKLNVELPKDFVDIYSTNNGQVTLYDKYDNWGIICGSKMLSIEQISDYFLWKTPEDTDKRMPILEDIENNYYIGMDLLPKSNGVYGQIICFGKYTDRNDFVIASSLTAFFEKINALIERGFLKYSTRLEKEKEIYDVRVYFEHEALDLAELVNKF